MAEPRKPYVHRLESVSAAALRLWQRLDPEVWGRKPKEKAMKKPRKKPAIIVAAPAIKTNGHTHFDADEQLRIDAARIVTAFNMAAQGVTVEAIVEGVRKYEKHEGVVQ